LIGLRQPPRLPSKSALWVHLSRAPTLAIEATPAAPAVASWRPFSLIPSQVPVWPRAQISASA